MSTFIASVHTQSKYDWYSIQKQFIAKTNTSTSNIAYGVVANGCNPLHFRHTWTHIQEKVRHLPAIEAALETFRKCKHDRFLLLDSDCWPVRPDWQEVLEKLLGDKYLYAAPARAENFDIFPHPCAFYMKREFLEHANFGYDKMLNLLGVEVSDLGMALPQFLHGRQVWHPLIKTNAISPHPVFASIYGDLFYHHCAGSRGPSFRADQYPFYAHQFPTKADHVRAYTKITTDLFKDPVKFVEKLRKQK